MIITFGKSKKYQMMLSKNFYRRIFYGKESQKILPGQNSPNSALLSDFRVTFLRKMCGHIREKALRIRFTDSIRTVTEDISHVKSLRYQKMSSVVIRKLQKSYKYFN